MTFLPPFCPWPECPAHRRPDTRFLRRGHYRRRCDGRSVPRFQCSVCRRHCSSQTFRLDYRQKRPELNRPLFTSFVSKVTMRQAARTLGCSRRVVAHRLNLFGRHCREFHRQRLEECPHPLRGRWVFDELETFENDRRLQPVTVPVLVESESYFVLHAGTAPMGARGRLSPTKQRRKAELEARYGKRRSGSVEAVKEAFTRLAQHAEPTEPVEVWTDKKASYSSILKRLFGGRVWHGQISSKARRDERNPLFPVNLSLAMLRDGLSRLVRRNWGASKKRGRLGRHLWIWIAWRNYVRYVTNRWRSVSPAMIVGVEHRRWSIPELLGPRVFGPRDRA